VHHNLTRASLDEGLSWADVIGLAVLGGLGFTVSLLIGEFAFGTGNPREEHMKVAVLTGTLIAALLASIVCGCGTGVPAYPRQRKRRRHQARARRAHYHRRERQVRLEY
jgi:hypothetical protein